MNKAKIAKIAKIAKTFSVGISDWKESLNTCIAILKEQK
jgi:hypothetical protein